MAGSWVDPAAGSSWPVAGYTRPRARVAHDFVQMPRSPQWNKCEIPRRFQNFLFIVWINLLIFKNLIFGEFLCRWNADRKHSVTRSNFVLRIWKKFYIISRPLRISGNFFRFLAFIIRLFLRNLKNYFHVKFQWNAAIKHPVTRSNFILKIWKNTTSCQGHWE